MPKTINVLEDLIKTLDAHGINLDEIEWVGSKCGQWECSLQDLNVEIPDNHGGPYTSPALVVVGETWWCSRECYNGCEYWIFNTIPEQSSYIQKLPNILITELNKDHKYMWLT